MQQPTPLSSQDLGADGLIAAGETLSFILRPGQITVMLLPAADLLLMGALALPGAGRSRRAARYLLRVI